MNRLKIGLIILAVLALNNLAFGHGSGHVNYGGDDFHIYVWHDHKDSNPTIRNGDNYHWHKNSESENVLLMHTWGTDGDGKGIPLQNGEKVFIQNPELDNNGYQIEQALIPHRDDGKDSTGTKYNSVAAATGNNHIRLGRNYTTFEMHLSAPVHGSITRTETITHTHSGFNEHSHVVYYHSHGGLYETYTSDDPNPPQITKEHFHTDVAKTSEVDVHLSKDHSRHITTTHEFFHYHGSKTTENEVETEAGPVTQEMLTLVLDSIDYGKPLNINNESDNTDKGTEEGTPTDTDVPKEDPMEKDTPTDTTVPKEDPTETDTPTDTTVPKEDPTETDTPTDTTVPKEDPIEDVVIVPDYEYEYDASTRAKHSVVLSEIMFETKGDAEKYPQWIELYNMTDSPINLNGWEIILLDRSFAVDYDFTIKPNNTVLIASHTGRYSGNITWDDLWLIDETIMDESTLNNEFFIRLYNDEDGEIDEISTLDLDDYSRWKIPSGIVQNEGGARTSIIRRFSKGNPVEGFKRIAWMRAYHAKNIVNSDHWYGHKTDIGTPLYRSARNPLPVQLSAFTAKFVGDKVVIEWATESEIDNAGFNIYRSKNFNGQFRQINVKLIQGAGTTGERNTYTWTDTTVKPNTVYYYQTEDVSFSGDKEVLVTKHVKGVISAKSKTVTQWAELKK